MKNKLKVDTIDWPSHWASYLINGDHSGINEQDREDCDNAVFDLTLELGYNPHFTDAGEQRFSWQSGDLRNGIGCDVTSFTYYHHTD